MSVKAVCPACGTKYTLDERIAGKRLRCRNCRQLFLASQSASAPVPEPEESPPRLAPLLVLTLVWLVLGWNLAQMAPWLGLTSEVIAAGVNRLALVVTIVLIGFGLMTGFRIVRHTGHTLSALPVTVAQILLFHLLFFQIACHLGANHYDWEHAPAWWDWLAFTGAHTFRAADLFDTLEAYGWRMQAIQHAHWLVGGALIAFHLLVDLFLISLLLEGVHRFRRAVLKGQRRAKLALWALGGLAIVWLLTWLHTALIWRPWQASDLLLWPLDNLLRVIDFPDVMQIAHLRLHDVPALPWEGTLAFVLRLLLVIGLAGILDRSIQAMRTRWLGVAALSPHQLRELVEAGGDPVRVRQAKRRLREVERYTAHPISSILPRRVAIRLGVVAGVGVLLGLAAAWILPSNEAAAKALAQRIREGVADAQRLPEAERALAAIRRMGANAGSVVSELTEAQAEATGAFRTAIVEALGELGPEAMPTLAELLGEDPDEAVQMAALRGLARSGPRAVPYLIGGLDANSESIRQEVASTIRNVGPSAVDRLIPHVEPRNQHLIFPLVEQLDPYWDLRPEGSSYFREVAAVRDEVDLLLERLTLARQNRDSSGQAATLLVLGEYGPAAGRGLPLILEALNDPDPDLQTAAAETLQLMGEVQLGAVDQLTTILRDSGPSQRTAASLLGTTGTAAQGAVIPIADAFLNDPGGSETYRWSLSQILTATGPLPTAREAIHRLVSAYPAREAAEQAWILTTLPQIDPHWEGTAGARRGVTELLLTIDTWTAEQFALMRELVDPVLMGDPLIEAADQIPEWIGKFPDLSDPVRTWLLSLASRIDPDWSRRESVQEQFAELFRAATQEQVQSDPLCQVIGAMSPHLNSEIRDTAYAETFQLLPEAVVADQDRIMGMLSALRPDWTETPEATNLLNSAEQMAANAANTVPLDQRVRHLSLAIGITLRKPGRVDRELNDRSFSARTGRFAFMLRREVSQEVRVEGPLLTLVVEMRSDADAQTRAWADQVLEDYPDWPTTEAARAAIPLTTARLGSSTGNVPEAARDTLVKLAGDPSGTLELLISGLRGGDPNQRVGAVKDIGQLGADARSALPELKALFLDPDPRVLEAVLMALIRIDPEAIKDLPNFPDERVLALIPSLADHLNSSTPNREACIELLKSMGDLAFPILVDRFEGKTSSPSGVGLGQDDWHFRRSLLRILGEIGLRSSNPLVQEECARLLLREADGPTNFLIEAREFSADPRFSERMIRVYLDSLATSKHASYYLARMERRPIPALLERVRSGSAAEQTNCLKVLADIAMLHRKIGQPPEFSEPETLQLWGELLLLPAAEGGDYAVSLLTDQGRLGYEVLLDHLCDAESSVLPSIGAVVGVHLEELKNRLPEILDATTSEQPAVRAAAARALSGRKGDPEIAPILLEMLGDAHPDVRFQALTSLNVTLNIKLDMLPLIIPLMREESDEMRRLVVRIALRFKSESELALQTVIEAQADSDSQVRTDVARSLKRNVPDWASSAAARAAVPALEEAAQSDKSWVREAAEEALSQIRAAAPPETDPPPPEQNEPTDDPMLPIGP